MDLILSRTKFRPDGIFGELRDSSKNLIAVTLEHAFSNDNGGWRAVIPEGTYSCVRGEHYLHGMTEPFKTFEVSNVEGHAGLLFHWGNFNKDSEGCILLGQSTFSINGGAEMIIHSRAAFEKFMVLQDGLLIFQILIIG